MSVFDDLTRQVRELYFKVADMERAGRNRSRIGTIAEVDAAHGRARVRLSSQGGKDYLSGWLPWSEQAAGAGKTHFPPSVGQQVRVRSESGDLTDGEIEMSVPSDTNARPSTRGDEFVLLAVGNVKASVSDGCIFLRAGNAQVAIANGTVAISVGGDTLATFASGQITLKSGLIVTEGETKLGEEDADDKVMLESGPAQKIKGK